jgi:hypothetical protein
MDRTRYSDDWYAEDAEGRLDAATEAYGYECSHGCGHKDLSEDRMADHEEACEDNPDNQEDED